MGVPEGITTLEDNKNSMKKRKYWALCGSFAGMLIFLVAIFLIYDYDPIRKQADSAINIVQTHQQDDSKIAHSEVLATESGEYLHCATDKKTGTFRYTKKKVKLTGREKTTCQHGRTGYIDVRCQYATDVSGYCDLCGLQQNDIREELWWGEWVCESVNGNEERLNKPREPSNSATSQCHK